MGYASEWQRIIPADAGSTRNVPRRSLWYKDHPRGCGEHLFLNKPSSLLSGSSPRMRGALDPQYLTIATARIIPADAGSTRRYLERHYEQTDHPRGCGEH